MAGSISTSTTSPVAPVMSAGSGSVSGGAAWALTVTCTVSESCSPPVSVTVSVSVAAKAPVIVPLGAVQLVLADVGALKVPPMLLVHW